MFRKMRRSNQELSIEESIQILKEQPRGFLSLLSENDYPYGIPMNYVYKSKKIILHSALEGQMVDSIKRHDKVSFTVINNGKRVENEWWNIFKSVIIFGKIKVVEDEKERIKKLTLLGNKYFPSEEYTQNEIKKSLKRTLVLEIDIENMAGKIVTEK